MVIRPAAPGEAAEISSLALRSKAHWGYSPDQLAVFEGELTLAPEDLTSRSAQVLEEVGTLLGFYTLVQHAGGSLELEHLFIDPAHLRRGYGSRLLRHAMRAATARGFAEVFVLSDPHATDFYRVHGAAVEAEISSSLPGRSMPRLTLPLPAADALIRVERPEDRDAVFRVVERAFGQSDEAELVDAIRSLRPSVSLVAEWRGNLVGHIFFSPVTVRSKEGASWPALALAPMAVAPERQQLGLGGRLVREGLEACRALGETRVFVLGHPEYYPRFGFEPAAPLGLHYRSAAFDGAFFAAALDPGALEGISGWVEYTPAFDTL